jgi:predicted Zn-dependent protease
VQRAAVVALGLLGGCAISTQQEIEMGASYARQIAAQLPIVRVPEVVGYLGQLGRTIAERADERNLTWHFYLVDSREVNAFALPGGYVYVNRGLVERTTRMSQLAGVLAHEIAHVTRRHSVKRIQKAQGADIGVTLLCTLTAACQNDLTGVAIQVGGSLTFAKFSRDDEREADALALDYVLRAGIDPRGVAELFRVLLEERQRSPGSLEAWFSTHPLEDERLAAAESRIAALGPQRLVGLSSDSPAYQEFRRRVLALPELRRPSGRQKSQKFQN